MNLKQLIIFGIENSSEPVIKNPILRAALEEPGSMVGTPTKEVTQHGRRIYDTPGGGVSEKSTTFFLNGQWMNVPSIHEGRAFTDDQLRRMIKEGTIQPTSVHGSRVEAETAAGQRSDMMKSHTRGFDDGGQVIGKPGGLVEPGVTHYATWKTKAGNIVSDKKTKKFNFPHKNQHGKIVFRQEPAKPTTLLDKYQGMTDDYDLLVKESVRVNDGTNLPKSFKDYVNSYTFPDGTKATYQQYSGLTSRSKGTKYRKSLKRPVDPINVKLTIMDNLITEANRGNKFVDLTTLAKKVDWTDKDISNYKRAGRIKKLETSSDKVDKVFKNFFNDLDAPLDNFFNPIYKMADETGLSRGVVSTLLNKNPDYTKKSARLIQTLGSYALQGKYAKEGLTIGQFLGDWENRLFIGENGLLSLKNYNKPVTSIVQDAWRHTNQGGTQIEWITPPKLDKKGDLISLADAQFKYTGPNGSDTIWSASGKTVNGIESKSISIYGKDAPEFKKVFQDYDDIFRLENEIKPHPVTGKPTKMIQIMKESYNLGQGKSFGTSSLARDHVDIINDVFGNDPNYGTRIVPRRVNEYAGALKAIDQATKKGLGKNYTQAKIDKIYDTMGYNYTKNYNQILNDEYNLSKKIFNKWQAAGWELDANNRWVIKEGFDENIARSIDARGNSKNPNKILRSPFQIAEDIKLPRSKFVPIGPEINLGQTHKFLKEAGFNIDKCLSSGGRVKLFAGGGVNTCIRGVIEAEQKAAKGGSKIAKAKFGKFASKAGWMLGWADIPIELAFALPHMLQGDKEAAKRATTLGLFGWGEKKLDEIKADSPEAYKYAKHVKDNNDWIDAWFITQDITEELKTLKEGTGAQELALYQLNKANAKMKKIQEEYVGYVDEEGKFDPLVGAKGKTALQDYLREDVKKKADEGFQINIDLPPLYQKKNVAGIAPYKGGDPITNVKQYIEQKGEPYWKSGLEHAAEEAGVPDLYDTFMQGADIKDPRDLYSELPLEYASGLGNLEKQEMLEGLKRKGKFMTRGFKDELEAQGIDWKEAYDTGWAEGGIASLNVKK